MAAVSMRRLLTRASALFVLAGVLWSVAPAASAQETPAATLTLVSQSIWNDPTRPLDITVRATNASTRVLGSLSFVLSIGTPATSRSVYELSLHADPTISFISNPFPQSGALQVGESRTFRLRQGLDQVPTTDNGLYPVRIQLLSADLPVGILRTPMVFLVEKPQIPLSLNTTWVLSDPIQYGPDGTFYSGPVETDIRPGGRLDAMISALDTDRPAPADVVASPVLVEELERLSQGYRIVDVDGSVRTVQKGTAGAADAARLLDALRRISADARTEIVPMPMGDASFTAMFQAHLQKDIAILVAGGANRIRGTLKAPPRSGVARPLFSQLDPRSLAEYARLGARTLLLDANFIPTPPDLRFSPSPLLRLTGGGRTATAVLPDSGLAAVAATYAADPVLDAHAVLGDLAAIWLEFPGVARGTAMLFPERSTLPPAFFDSVWKLVRGSPWLRSVTATAMVAELAQPERQALPRHVYPVFQSSYVASLLGAGAALDDFSATAGAARALVDRLRDRLLVAEGSTFVTTPTLGQRYIDSVQRAINVTYSRIRLASNIVTLTSRSGFIPVTVQNEAGFPVRVKLRLVADRRLDFTGGSTRELLLGTEKKTYLIPVRAQTTGRFPIKVQLLTPGSSPAPATIAETEMIVRSTAYNRVALYVTIGAGLFLLAWWGRRFLPRPTH
jgi:hypothetical protein